MIFQPTPSVCFSLSVLLETKPKRAESGFHDMNPSTDEDEMASSDSHENDEEDDDEDDSDPTAQRERIRRNHVWAIISLLEEQAKGPYHLMVSTNHPTHTKHNHWQIQVLADSVASRTTFLTRYWICFVTGVTNGE